MIPADIQEILDRIINPSAQLWDVIMLGDGSGSRYGQPGGWACLIYDKLTATYKTIYGSVSDTTVNMMELTPYLYSTIWYHNKIGKDRRDTLRKSGHDFVPIIIYMISDCEILVKQGCYEAERKTNKAMWEPFREFERQGYEFRWYFVPRDVLEANKVCDLLSKKLRLLIAKIDSEIV